RQERREGQEGREGLEGQEGLKGQEGRERQARPPGSMPLTCCARSSAALLTSPLSRWRRNSMAASISCIGCWNAVCAYRSATQVLLTRRRWRRLPPAPDTLPISSTGCRRSATAIPDWSAQFFSPRKLPPS